MTGLTQKTVLW